MKRRCAGFTVLEVLVAFAILGIGLTALTRVSAAGPARVEDLWQRGLAEMLAQDVLHEVALGLRAAQGPEASGERQMAGRRFGFQVRAQGDGAIRVDVGLYPRSSGLVTTRLPMAVQAP